MSTDDRSLRALYARCEVASDAAAGGDDQWQAHAAVLDCLAESRRIAEAAGWTSCAIERDGDAGRFQLFGIPPVSALRMEVPDYSGDADADADADSGRGS